MIEHSEVSTYATYGKYCGTDNPGHVTLDSAHARIRFVTDSLIFRSGFRLEWENWGKLIISQFLSHFNEVSRFLSVLVIVKKNRKEYFSEN